MDADLPKDDAEKAALRQNGTSVFDWDKPNALEEQIFFDIPTDIATKLISIVVNERGVESVKSYLTVGNIPFEIMDGEIHFSDLDGATKKKIGTVAKQKSWYKRIDLGELLCNVVFDFWESIDKNSKLKAVVDALSKWVIGND